MLNHIYTVKLTGLQTRLVLILSTTIVQKQSLHQRHRHGKKNPQHLLHRGRKNQLLQVMLEIPEVNLLLQVTVLEVNRLLQVTVPEVNRLLQVTVPEVTIVIQLLQKVKVEDFLLKI